MNTKIIISILSFCANTQASPIPPNTKQQAVSIPSSRKLSATSLEFIAPVHKNSTSGSVENSSGDLIGDWSLGSGEAGSGSGDKTPGSGENFSADLQGDKAPGSGDAGSGSGDSASGDLIGDKAPGSGDESSGIPDTGIIENERPPSLSSPKPPSAPATLFNNITNSSLNTSLDRPSEEEQPWSTETIIWLSLGTLAGALFLTISAILAINKIKAKTKTLIILSPSNQTQNATTTDRSFQKIKTDIAGVRIATEEEEPDKSLVSTNNDDSANGNPKGSALKWLSGQRV